MVFLGIGKFQYPYGGCYGVSSPGWITKCHYQRHRVIDRTFQLSEWHDAFRSSRRKVKTSGLQSVIEAAIDYNVLFDPASVLKYFKETHNPRLRNLL